MNTAHEPVKRLSLSEIVALLLQRGGGDRSSTSLTRNARGITQIEVVVRTGDTDETRTAADAAAEAVRLYEQLRALYPYPAAEEPADPKGGK